jgi:Tetratricopeptide repeat
MPRLPFEVRNQIQEGRADLYTFDGMPAALHSVMTEILAKVNTGIHYRSTQILCATMGRLFALLGRHEEAALCFYTSLTHRSKPRWRTYDSFHLRMHDYARSPNGNMGVRRLRDQLLEAEHDLFLFSLVYELIILGQSEEAIQEMQAVRDIGVAPNGLYLERETGRSFTIIMHRVTDARNLLIGILLENGMLQEIEEMKQEYDLADTLGAQSLGQKPTPEQAFQCFLTTERVASMLYQRGRFDDAVRMQRRLLAVCSQKLIHRTTADIQLLRQALALSLSRCENMVCVEEASTIQDELMERTLGEGKEPLFSLRLNQVHTLARLGRLGADCDLIRCLLQDDHERKIVVLESCVSGQSQFGASFFWLHELSDGLRTASIVQLALLATCVHLQDQAQLRLITLLGTNPSTSSVLNNFEELICFLKDATLQSNASVLHHLMLWDRLVCLLLYIGTVWEQREKFDLAQQASEDMTNYVSIMSEDPEDEIRAAHLRSLVSRAKAHYLNTTSSYAAADAEFWNNALKAHRMAQQEGQNNGKGVMTADSLFKVSLAAMLKEKVIAFGDSDEVKELLDLYEDIDTKQDDLLAVRVEHAHITSALNLTNQDNYPHDDDPLRSALAECETTLGPSHSFTNQTRTRLAYSLERHGHFSEARNLLWEVAEHVKTTFGSDHPQTLRARFNFLKLQSTRAVELGLHEYSYLPGLSGLRYSAAKVFGKEHPTTQEYLGAYALALERDERAITEAIATKREVVRALNETLGVEHARTIQEESELAGMLCRRGGEDHSEGRVHFECSLRSAAAFYGVSHPRTWALWRECVSAVIASTSGDEVAASPKRTALSFNADSEPVHYDQNDHMVSALDPGAREILLSHFLLGADHPLTTEMQQRQSNPTQQYARTAPSNEETAAKFFPIPPTKQLKEQWSEFLEPLRKIYEKQRVYGLLTRREALELGKNRFQASGGFRLKYQNV